MFTSVRVMDVSELPNPFLRQMSGALVTHRFDKDGAQNGGSASRHTLDNVDPGIRSPAFVHLQESSKSWLKQAFSSDIAK